MLGSVLLPPLGQQMAREQRSYSIEELSREAGVGVDTLNRWRDEGLIPSPRTRGNQLRYPREALDRLRFVVRVMGLIDRGEMEPLPLSELAASLNALDPHDIVTANEAELPAERLAAMLCEPDESSRTAEHRKRSLKPTGARRQRRSESPVSRPVDHEPGRQLDELARLMRELSSRSDTEPALGNADAPTFSPVPISDQLVLFVKGLSAEDRELAEELARRLRNLLDGR